MMIASKKAIRGDGKSPVFFYKFYLFFYFFYFCQNYLTVTSEVTICTGYTLFANTLTSIVHMIYKSLRCFLPSFESISLSVQKKKGKIDFQDGRHLGFPIGTVLAIFISTSHPDPSYQFSNQLALWFRKISEKKGFKMATMTAILDFRSKQFKLF